MAQHPKRTKPTRTQFPKLVTLKVTPRIHDELFGFVGALQAERKRRVTIAEAITELLETYKECKGYQPPPLPEDFEFSGSGIYGRGRLPKRLDNPEQEGDQKTKENVEKLKE
jgi:hypothetical protein